jgi:hypothetical protein
MKKNKIKAENNEMQEDEWKGRERENIAVKSFSSIKIFKYSRRLYRDEYLCQ